MRTRKRSSSGRVFAVAFEFFTEKFDLLFRPDDRGAPENFVLWQFARAFRHPNQKVEVVRHQAEGKDFYPRKSGLPKHHVLKNLFLAFGAKSKLLVYKAGNHVIDGPRPPDESWFTHGSIQQIDEFRSSFNIG